MFKKTRKKIIALIMGSLVLLFALTLSVIMLASYREMRTQNAQMLETYTEQYRLEPQGRQGEMEPPEWQNDSEQQQGGQEDLGPRGDDSFFLDDRWSNNGRWMDNKRNYQLSTFYSVAFSEDNIVLAVNNGDNSVYTEEDLIKIATEVLQESKSSGRVGNLSYKICQKEGYFLVAFKDDTVAENSLSMLLKNILIVGGAAIIVLFFLSLYLSKRIVRPLEENDEQQKQFISNASHELKTPVAVISANAEILSRELGENEWLANIEYENERMGELVKQLLDLSRAENKESPMEQVDFSRIATGEVLALESLAFEQGKEIQSDIEEDISLIGNASQLTQLVSILLDNAIRHSTGSKIEVELKHHGHAAVLSVENDGDEISQEKLEHLFDRFYRLDEARNSEGHHYGLGLSIAKAVAEKHGGSISASYQDGKVKFTVSLPINNK